MMFKCSLSSTGHYLSSWVFAWNILSYSQLILQFEISDSKCEEESRQTKPTEGLMTTVWPFTLHTPAMHWRLMARWEALNFHHIFLILLKVLTLLRTPLTCLLCLGLLAPNYTCRPQILYWPWHLTCQSTMLLPSRVRTGRSHEVGPAQFPYFFYN